MTLKELQSKIDKLIWQDGEVNKTELSSLLPSLSVEELKKLRSFVMIQKGMGENWCTSSLTVIRGEEVCSKSMIVCELIDSLIPVEA